MMETAQKLRTNSNNARSYGLVPIGGIVFCGTTLTNLPALGPDFVQCNGQVITDSQSPLFGQTIPNINGNGQFLRGGASSGASGGTTSITISGSVSLSIAAASISYTTGLTTAQFAAASGNSANLSISGNPYSTLPPFYQGPYAMRIK